MSRSRASAPSSIHIPRAVGAALLVLAGCSNAQGCGAATALPMLPAASCPVCGSVEARGALADRSIDEASGIAVSAAHPGVLYVHNDSGDSARFFAISDAGATMGEFRVAGAQAIDWEDMALGPCAPGGPSCLYFADTGDNKRARDRYVIYRVKEPAAIEGGVNTVEAEALSFVYPDGPHDAEALLVHPVTGAVTIVTKVRSGSSPVYELPSALTPEKTATAVKVAEITPPRGSPRFTSGDVQPQGKGVLLRTYTDLFYYPMGPDQTPAQALQGLACGMPVADESQGESVAWLPSGDGYITVSEGVKSALNVVSCPKQ